MDSKPSHTPAEVGILLLIAVERYTQSVFRDLDETQAEYRRALRESEPVKARKAYRLLGEIGGLASNFINLMEHSLRRVPPEQAVSQIWGDIDVHLRYHAAGDHGDDEIPPLHTLLMDVLNGISFQVSGFGTVTLEGETFPKLPEESDARAYSRLTRDVSRDVRAQFKDDVFATRRRRFLEASQEDPRSVAG